VSPPRSVGMLSGHPPFMSSGMLHLPHAPFSPFKVLNETHVAKKDSRVEI